MGDDLAMVDRIYTLAAQPMTPTARTAMRTFLSEHPRGRHGSVHYDLVALGLDRAERREGLAFYVEHFGVHVEQ